MRKLSNDELATRTREANRRRGQRQRERLTIAGRAALTVWVPVGLRSRFVNEAAGLGVNINELAERYLDAGLRESRLRVNLPEVNSDPTPETADLFAMPDPEPQTLVVVASEPATHKPVSVSFDRTAMMTTIGELIDAGHSGAEIARRLTAAGHRTSAGTELIGANVLREYRRWKEKNNGSDSTAV